MSNINQIKIVHGQFALVFSGNVTKAWMVDGDDIQQRANAALNPYWGDTAKIYDQHVEGWALMADNSPYAIELYTSEMHAQRALGR